MKEEMETIKLRSGNQLARENYLLLNKSKAQILNILLNTEEKMEDLQSQLKAKEEERLVDGYYQSNIKTSRNEDSVYAMKYASQQILIDKLEEENKSLQSQLKAKEEVIKEAREYIKEHIRIDDEYPAYMEMLITERDELDEILSKGENK